MIIIGTMAIVITFGGSITTDKTSASALPPARHSDATVKDDFLRALGASSDQEVYDALYNGKSLAELAAGNHQNIDAIINLQIAQLTEQLDTRLLNGSISPKDYFAQKAEIREIITNSVLGN